ncbi:hypothetical protein HXX76_003812 [Chlamydomonas incerta]|uniref:HMA domain-containing protein n=1 Tax=Chlamydomonas incerta TaxID=51695 RepID=A0A835TIE2_CHLIN|nr:hypothetical protein HXX76_003812 [Chlamydomonas incerta]|eukprot:KAG2440959.1 hypothetical protein HXX76_003812 [Chlamydomonas incerta]
MRWAPVLVLGALLLPAALLVAQDAGVETEQEEFMEDLQAPGETITIKLQLGTKRDRAAVRDLAGRLKSLPLLASTSIAVVGRDKLVLTPSAKHDVEKVKQLLLQQPEIYELEVNEQAFRRPGAKPYEQVRKEHLAESMASSRSSLQSKIKDKLRSLLGSRKKGAEAGGGGDDGAKRKRRRKVKKSKGDKAGSADGEDGSPEKEAQRVARHAQKKAKRDAKRRELKREGAVADEEQAAAGRAAGGAPAGQRVPPPNHIEMGHPDLDEYAGYEAGQGNMEL